ncbi:MAG: multicopper oxidase family protein [Pyrinomonadaceae bacterium]|nr:multicopper oxidase family protein [Pyrinomonadaceae bacterium]
MISKDSFVGTYLSGVGPKYFRWISEILGLAGATIVLLLRVEAQVVTLPAEPEVRSRERVITLKLSAVTDPNGHYAFAYNGKTVPPVIRVSPGQRLNIDYLNALPRTSRESCATGPCMNMSNLHFHGLHVSPRSPQDDVLTMLAMPGDSLHYLLNIPLDQPSGLYWYHPHPHGESDRQVLDGMSGAIVVEGIERYLPELARIPERLLVVRAVDIEHEAEAVTLKSRMAIPATPCGASTEPVERIFTVNGAVRPAIDIAPGERQFWRILNAAADRYIDVQVDGQPFEVVALDGMPLAYHNPSGPKRFLDHILLPPAGRVEAIVTGPPQGSVTALRTRCVDTGPDGDANPEMVLADVVAGIREPKSTSRPAAIKGPAVYKIARVNHFENSIPDFVATFTEDKYGFYINGRKFEVQSEPMLRVKVGSYQHWRIVNATREIHPFHIHQVHFWSYAENGVRRPDPEWLDTANVPIGGSIDLIMDFTDPIIRGMSVFHCHLLNHEDKGMMAKILFH